MAIISRTTEEDQWAGQLLLELTQLPTVPILGTIEVNSKYPKYFGKKFFKRFFFFCFSQNFLPRWRNHRSKFSFPNKRVHPLL